MNFQLMIDTAFLPLLDFATSFPIYKEVEELMREFELMYRFITISISRISTFTSIIR